jgi:hypothetical protein
MKKLIAMPVLFVMALVILSSAAACASAGTTAAKTTVTATTTANNKSLTTITSAVKTTTTAAGVSGGTIADILAKAAFVTSMQFDMVQTNSLVGVQGGNGTVTTHVWVSRNKVKMDTNQGGQEIIQLYDYNAHVMYSYTPAQNAATKTTIDPTTVYDDPNAILQYDPTTAGTDTINGNLCQIIQYVNQGTTIKIWLWEAKGLVLKEEATNPAAGSYTIVNQNYDFSAIPDSTFVLPAGVTVNGN